MALLTVRSAASKLGSATPRSSNGFYRGDGSARRRTTGGHHRVSDAEVDRLLARTAPVISAAAAARARARA